MRARLVLVIAGVGACAPSGPAAAPVPPPAADASALAAPSARDAGAPHAPPPDGGLVTLGNAEAVIAGNRPALASCYDEALRLDPSEQGRVTLRLHVAPDGSVTSVDAIDADGLSPATTRCLAAQLREARFDAAPGSGSVVDVPLVFRPRSPPPVPALAPSSAPPTARFPAMVAGFRFGMTVAEADERCRAVGTPNPLTGDDPELRLRTCDGVEVEPGMRLNVFLGFCDGDTRLCEVAAWTNRNAALAYRSLEAKLVERFGNAPVVSRTLRDETLVEECAHRDGRVRLTWWWGSPPAPTTRVLLALKCKGGAQSVNVYYDDPRATTVQVRRARTEGILPSPAPPP